MKKYVDPYRPLITWYDTDDTLGGGFRLAVDGEYDNGEWTVDYYITGAISWVTLATYDNRADAEQAAEVFFITRPWQ